MNRLAGLLGFCCLCAMLAVAPAFAAKKAAPEPSPSPSPAAQPTAEPLDVAIPRLQAKVKADPNDHDSQAQLAGDYLAAGRPDLALALTQQLISGGLKTSMILYMDAYAHTQMGQHAESIADLEQASNLDPTNASVLTLLTNEYLGAGRMADADRIAKRATTFNKDDVRVWMNYGVVLASEKKYDDARQQFEVAAKMTPTDATPVLFEARTYIDQNAPALAISLFDRALTIDPNSVQALTGKAQVLGATHDVKGAIAVYETLLAKLSDSGDKAAVVDAEAHLYATEKMNADADAQYKRAIALFPTVPATHIAYGDYFAYINDRQSAEREWTAALGPNNDNHDALGRLGELYAQSNDFPKAEAEFQRLIDLNGNDAAAMMSLGEVQLAARQSDKAHDSFKKAYDLTHAPQALAALAQADFNLRNFKEAAQIFDDIGQEVPQFMDANPGLYIVAGRCYGANHEGTKAKTAFSKFLTFVKPDSQEANEVKKLIAEIDHPSSEPAPAPRPSAKPSSAPASH